MRVIATLLGLVFCAVSQAEVVASKRTGLQLIGADQTVSVTAVDDPLVPGVTCYVSYFSAGGVASTLGFSAPGRVSLSCSALTDVAPSREIIEGQRDGEELAAIDNAYHLGALRVYRYYDGKRDVLIYLAISAEKQHLQQALSVVHRVDAR